MAPAAEPDGPGIEVHLDEIVASRNITLTELARRVGITVVNLSVLKNGRPRTIRFSTLAALCEVLQCQPGDVLRYRSAEGGHSRCTRPGRLKSCLVHSRRAGRVIPGRLVRLSTEETARPGGRHEVPHPEG